MEAGTTVQITMPEMGESVTEGTILEWLKQVGDEVQADEGIVEVSTDKVDAEIPAPASGILTKILVEADETVPTGAVLGEIEVDGAEEVEMLFSANPGEPPAPLARVASGGELSRVMLAIRTAGAEADRLPTLVFDEVDAGVGGRAAVEIGRRLARLARAHQVLVVTHLPQVAAFADRHLVVAKDTSGAVTTSGVTVVEDTERARELARMLAGLPDSDLGIAHAEELLAVAEREKSG